ncbi:protein S100-A11 [Thalassophryne amazonica]|uniref:protein S100-A11 n=1 Tax=Thalassophryne amazonica TaxID=390379 RepID=UPI001470E5D7|nr:protein S100-A11 [Thalassophryne amazonica]
MEAAIDTLIQHFKDYAGRDGSSTLNRNEFHQLVAEQLSNFMKPQDAKDPGVADRLMNSLDQNNDGELTFSEFWHLVGTLASKQGGFSQ